MLGEKIHEIQGRVTGMRVLPGENGGVRIEITFQGSGKMLDAPVTETGTYVATPQADGTLFGEGNGLVLTSGGEAITWRGQGRGRPTGKGMGASWRGSIYYQSAAARFARLNGVPAVFEWDIDEEGNAKGTIWEWK